VPGLLRAEEPWQAALKQMPLGTNVTWLDRTNCVELMLRAFQSNNVVKALILMPGASDEFFMYHRARAQLTNSSPTLLDAVSALTNQTHVRFVFQSPFLLMYSDEDPLDIIIDVEYQPLVDRLKQTPFEPHICYLDQDWDSIQPVLKRKLKVDMQPWKGTYNACHLYRHSIAAWNLNCWEALQALAYADKATITVRRRMNIVVPLKEIILTPDKRMHIPPKLDGFLR
jgi:hypothetical protein